MNDRSNRILKITAFARVIILISTIVGYSIYLFARGREEKISEWGGAESADILDDSEPERYSLPFGKDVTITYSGPDNWYVAASLSNNLPVWQEVAERTGVNFSWQVLPSAQWNQSMKLKINGGGELPDMMGIPDWGNGDINKYAKEKVIIPLNELINKYAPNIKRILKENPLLRKQMTAADGNIYSIDEFFSANHYDKAVIIRKDWLKKCGYSETWIPKTKEEFVEVMERFRDYKSADNLSLSGSADAKNGVIPLVAAEGYMYDLFCSGFGLSAPLQDCAVDENGKVVFQRATPAYGEFLDWMAELYTNKLLYSGYAASSESDFEKLIIQNRVGISVAAGDTMDKYNSLLKKYGIDGEYILINPPTDDEGNIKLVKRSLSGGQIGISYDCRNPVTVIRLMDYLWASNEGMILMHYGLEGITYDYDDNGNIAFTDFVTNNRDGLDKASALRSVGAWGPLFDHQTLEFMSLLYPEQANRFYAKNLENDIYIDPFPKILPTASEASRTGGLSTNLTTYQSEYHMRRILGGTSQTYAQYLAEMERLGVRQYEKYRQEQYERFSAL